MCVKPRQRPRVAAQSDVCVRGQYAQVTKGVQVAVHRDCDTVARAHGDALELGGSHNGLQLVLSAALTPVVAV